MGLPQNILEALRTEILPSAYLDYRLYLATLYERCKRELSPYSYGKFADHLGFGATTVMHQIVSGRRPLTTKAAERIVKALGLTGMERRYFLALVEYGNAKNAARRTALFETMLDLKRNTLPTELDKDVLSYFSEWYHPVIRELAGTKSFKSDPEWISRRVTPRLRPEQARESMALLERLGLIVFDEGRGRHVQTQKRVSTGSRVQGMALVGYHQAMIDLGKDALTRIPGKQRDISSMTLNVDESTLARLKDMIHAFQLQLLDEAERTSGDEVVQVNIQLFPFTAPGSKESA